MNFKNYIHQIPGGALPPPSLARGGLEPRSPPVLYAYGSANFNAKNLLTLSYTATLKFIVQFAVCS